MQIISNLKPEVGQKLLIIMKILPIIMKKIVKNSESKKINNKK